MSHWNSNFAAVGEVSPALAGQLERASVPAGFERVTGTEGTATFCRTLPGPPGRLEWLGGTSMPRASAEPLVASLDASGGGAGGSGLGLSIGTGYEWAAFVRRLSPGQALYVYEPDAGELRMALEVCDLSELIVARKLVLLSGRAEEAGAALVAWLTDHVGMEPPTVLHPLPTLTHGNVDRRNGLLAAGEMIVRRAVQHRQGQVNELSGRLMAALEKGAAGAARTVGIIGGSRYRGERPLHGLLEGAPTLVLASHLSVSLAGRIAFLAEQLETGPVRVASDLFRTQLGCVPPSVAVETWVPPIVGPGYWDQVPAIGANDGVVVHSHDHRSRLVEKGVAEGQVMLRPLPPVVGKGIFAAAGKGGVRERVAIVADLPRTSAEALGLVLPTQQAFHAAAGALVAEDFLGVHPAMAADLLRRAMARAGIQGAAQGDPAFRTPMLRLVRDLLIPVVPVLTLARQLAEQGIPLTLIGDWPELGLAPSDRVRFVPFSAGVAERWDGAAMLLHFSPEGTVPALLWEAVAAGVPVVGIEHPTDGLAGALPGLLEPGSEYLKLRRGGPLAGAIKQYLRDGGELAKFAAAAKIRLESASPVQAG